jgi:predicted TIM-barrel fold metal-dependent hydrolase
MPQYFKQHPVETFKKNIFVVPFIEDSFEDLAKQIDVSRIVFGSDYPHPEGATEPLDFLAELTAFNAADQQKIMSTNLKGLLEGKRD